MGSEATTCSNIVQFYKCLNNRKVKLSSAKNRRICSKRELLINLPLSTDKNYLR